MCCLTKPPQRSGCAKLNMSELASLQRRFGSGLDAVDAKADTLDMFLGEAEHVRRRFAIYCANTLANAVKAIEAAYPVVAKIVGDEYFGGLARQYRLRFASRAGDLNEYGECFADFLAGFAPVQDLPYLPDVARLEWLVHRAHYAANAPPFDPASLVSVPLQQQLELRPRVHPACYVMHSIYPIARIWEVHQAKYSGTFQGDFSHEPSYVLVSRPGFRAEVACISAAEAAFLSAALGDATLASALSAAQERDASFDLGSSLLKWVQSSLIVGFELNAA
jgi:hypothetical protein